MAETAIKIENLTKQYRLGAIGGQTLNAELQSWWARKRGKEDPNLKIGQTYDNAGEKFMALKGINLEIKKGEAVGIIGGNGAGKSTLLKILSRVTAPTSGDVWINGKISSMLEVGTGFHGELTGRENIYMNGAILGMTKKEVDAKIESIIDFSECRQFIDTPVKRYSSGMYVKLAFAVASHLDADIMVMDEVLAVGDMKFQKKCLGKMGEEAKGGKTVLYVSHNMATIRNLCSRCVVLEKGRIIFDGDVEKAISVYMDTSEGEFRKLYDFSDLKRTSIEYTKIRLNSLEFLNKKTPVYDTEEPMRVSLRWKTLQDVSGMRVRAQIHYADGNVVGMCESKAMKDVYAGEDSEITFEMNLSNLAPGTYYMIVSLFTLDYMGMHRGIDDTPERVFFKVEDTVADRTAWLRQYWGSVRFDEIKLLKDCEV